MFQPIMETYDRLPAWWEAECVRYGLTHVKRRLKTIMGTHVVRLTDREYMVQLAAKLQEHHETQQRSRIERRKLRPTTIVPQLRGSLSLKRERRKVNYCGLKYVDQIKRCKPLSQMLFVKESEIARKIVPSR